MDRTPRRPHPGGRRAAGCECLHCLAVGGTPANLPHSASVPRLSAFGASMPKPLCSQSAAQRQRRWTWYWSTSEPPRNLSRARRKSVASRSSPLQMSLGRKSSPAVRAKRFPAPPRSSAQHGKSGHGAYDGPSRDRRSAALKWVLLEEHSANARAFLRDAVARDSSPVAPPLMPGEATNAIYQRQRRAAIR